MSQPRMRVSGVVLGAPNPRALASLADHQPQERVRVMLDPAGHPFCLFTGQV